MPSILREHVALDSAWGDAVDGDTPLAKVGGEGLDHPDHSHLGCVIQCMVFDAEQACSDGCHEDHAAVVLDVLPCGLADEELRACVEVEDVVELLLRNV